MGKITQAAREIYVDRVKEYDDQINALLKREKAVKEAINKDKTGAEYKKTALADDRLNMAALYLLKNRMWGALLGGKNNDLLDGARKSCYEAVIFMEQVVSDVIDAPFSEYADRLELIEKIPDDQRYRLVQKMGFTIQTVEEDYGDNNKWKWSFVELEGRFTTITKNLMNLKTMVAGLDPRVPGYEERLDHLRFVKDLLNKSADRYREKYELNTFRMDDFRQGIAFLSALKRIHTLLGEAPQAENTKRKMEVWKAKMEDDEKRLEERRP